MPDIIRAEDHHAWLALTSATVAVSLFVALLGGNVAALSQTVPDRADASSALERGKRIVAYGGDPGVTACAACHGLGGAGDGSGAFPRLSAMPALYATKQLRDYKSGARRNALMGPIAAAMTEDQMRDASLWYAGARADAFPAQPVDPKVLARGAELALHGDPRLGLGGCRDCHGWQGASTAPNIPGIAGQFPAYAAYQFAMWRSGSRRNDLGGGMRDVAHRLGEADVAALAAYYGTLPVAADSKEVLR